MNAVLKIEDVEKPTEVLTIIQDTSTIDRWESTITEIETITPFSDITIERNGVEIFEGRVENPKVEFSRGSFLSPFGFDYTILLTDYLAPSASLVDVSTAVAIATILTNTPFNISIESLFSYITTPIVIDTTLEFLQLINYTDTSLEYDPTSIEIDDEFADAVAIADLGNEGLHNCFFYDGATERFYIFTREGNDIFYYRSTDGLAWTRTDTGVNSNSAAWGVGWHDSKVYLFVFDGANTDFYRGTIDNGTGVLAIGIIAGNIFANEIRFGPVFDNDGHIWVVAATATGTAYESVNDGVAWNNRFSAPANHTLWAVLPQGTDGDMFGFVVDVPNDDLEEWLWDRSASTFTFVIRIRGTVNDINSLDGGSNADYRPQIAWRDLNDGFFAKRDDGGGWTDSVLPGGGNVNNVHISVDMGLSAYVFVNRAIGTFLQKYTDGSLISSTDYAARPWGVSGVSLNCPAVHPVDLQVGIFGCGTDFNDDGWFFLTDYTGARLNRGETTGSIVTDSITAGGSFIRWGYVVALGVQLLDTEWSVLDGADVVLVSGQTVDFDMDFAGVDPSETTIKIQADLTDTGTDPFITEIDVSERIDEVTLDLDFEETFTSMRKWASLSGGEFWMTKDNGTFTLHVAATRGSDKSATVVLKNAKTALFPDVEPNIRIAGRNPDWSSYVNSIKLIGAGTIPNRVEVEVINQDGIDEFGVHQGVIRDIDVETDAMGQTRAAIELDKRGVVVERINIDFLDEYDPTDIEIGDTVQVVVEFGDDAGTKINSALRIIKLIRRWSASGERVEAELINLLQASQFIDHLEKVSNLERWITVV